MKKEELNKVLENARLALSESEEEMLGEMRGVLELFAKIDEVKEEAEPAFQPFKVKNVMRRDKAKKFAWNPFSNSKNVEGRYFRGPKVIE